MADVNRLEWALVVDAAPDEWHVVETDDRSLQGPFELRFPKCFDAWDSQGRTVDYYFTEWSTAQQGVAVYVGPKYHQEFGVGIPGCTAVVRQVPTCLVFACQITVLPESHSFQAVFATLSGKNVMRLEESLPSVLVMERISISITETALDIGMLQSLNQHVRVLLNGSCAELPDDAILWCERAPIGWLQKA